MNDFVDIFGILVFWYFPLNSAILTSLTDQFFDFTNLGFPLIDIVLDKQCTVYQFLKLYFRSPASQFDGNESKKYRYGNSWWRPDQTPHLQFKSNGNFFHFHRIKI
jgi:hypothetical protein